MRVFLRRLSHFFYASLKSSTKFPQDRKEYDGSLQCRPSFPDFLPSHRYTFLLILRHQVEKPLFILLICVYNPRMCALFQPFPESGCFGLGRSLQHKANFLAVSGRQLWVAAGSAASWVFIHSCIAAMAPWGL